MLVGLVADNELEGFEGAGVAGGEDSTTWELEPGTLMVIGLWLAEELAEAETPPGGASLGRVDD